MTQQEEIAQFLDQHVTWPRMGWDPQVWLGEIYPNLHPRPTSEELAREFLAMPEMRALQLGTWFGTTDGELIVEAVELVTPSFYRQDVELLVDALKLAAQLQYQEGQSRAGAFALAAVGVAVLVAIAVSSGGSSQAK